jgi:pyruvate/2-oxoglutarate dehydrogenase complex dihydrolipoamide acyltransferase (E2) component
MPNVPGHFVRDVSSWRRLAIATWQPANDPTIYGMLRIDASRALAYAERLSRQSGRHITITHLAASAVARTLARHPECNAYVRWGRLYQRDNVDVFVLVAVPSSDGEHTARADLTGVKLTCADRKTVPEIAGEIEERAQAIRKGRDATFAKTKGLMQRVPMSVLQPLLKLLTFAQYDLNLDLTRLGVPRDSFGGAFVTNIGPLGIPAGFAPIVPVTRLALNVALGRIEEAPLAENGQVVVRPVLPLTATFDHRVVDGYHAGRLSNTFVEMLQDPERHLE